MRGATNTFFHFILLEHISTHAPLARRDALLTGTAKPRFNFYSRASCEARLKVLNSNLQKLIFLLTRLLRGATAKSNPSSPNATISTHAPLARRDGFHASTKNSSVISTHAPLARRDSAKNAASLLLSNFYSRASCEARRTGAGRCHPRTRFLLTRLLRGATNPFVVMQKSSGYFYSRASCEARRGRVFARNKMKNFYSRASCEARRRTAKLLHQQRKFLLTRLLRGATRQQIQYDLYRTISTHAPLARRDQYRQCQKKGYNHFYSRASCEARPLRIVYAP